MTVGERIMQLRVDRNYTREQLSFLADISQKFLYEIEMDKKGFSAHTLMKLSDALEVSMDFIMLGEDNRKREHEIMAVLERFEPDKLQMIQRMIQAAYELPTE